MGRSYQQNLLVLDKLMFRLAVNSSQDDMLEHAMWLYAVPMGRSVQFAPARDDGHYRLLPAEQKVEMRQSRTI